MREFRRWCEKLCLSRIRPGCCPLLLTVHWPGLCPGSPGDSRRPEQCCPAECQGGREGSSCLTTDQMCGQRPGMQAAEKPDMLGTHLPNVRKNLVSCTWRPHALTFSALICKWLPLLTCFPFLPSATSKGLCHWDGTGDHSSCRSGADQHGS